MTGWDDINSLKDQLQANPLLGDPTNVLLLACHGSMLTAEQVKKRYFSDISLSPLNHTLTIRFKADHDKKQFSLHRIVLVKAKQ